MVRLNNKGQTLIMFVVLIPLVLIVMALVIDISYVTREKTKLESVTKNIIRDSYKNQDDINSFVYDLYKKNDIPTKNIKIKITDNKISIKNKYKIDSIFGKIIGIKKYNVSISLKGINEEDKIKITKE